MLGGYHGKILEIDLQRKKTSDIALKESVLKALIGGAGLAAAMLYSRLFKELGPLSPKASLAFMTGPFTGHVPFSGRYAVAGKSPLSELWGESTAGGFFGVALKQSGYDGLIIVGKSEKPTYIHLVDGKVEFCNAKELWGMKVSETVDILKSETERDSRIACIGPAGEKLVKYAAIIHDFQRVAGRTGMGAVMGSKNLKAIVITGDAGLPPVANESKVKWLYSQILDELSLNPFKEIMHVYGTLAYITQGYELGDTPAKYFTEGMFPAFKVSGEAIFGKYDVETEGCANCPVICGHKVKGVKLEYESVASLGPLCGVYDLDYILEATKVCNEYGMDSISAGVTIAFTMYLRGKGVLKDAPSFGDAKALVSTLKKIAERDGIGDLLAEGTKRIAERLGVGLEEVANVKGVEIPMHDPRAFSMMSLSYATSVRGACHLKSDYYGVDMGAFIPDLGVFPTNRFDESEAKVKMFITHQNVRELWNSYVLCMFGLISVAQTAEFHSAIIGESITPKDLVKIGENTFNFKRLLNFKLGMRKEQEKLPKIVTSPLTQGGTSGYSPNVEKMLSIYYNLRGYDQEGKPTGASIPDFLS